jgi:hypothetical protein
MLLLAVCVVMVKEALPDLARGPKQNTEIDRTEKKDALERCLKFRCVAGWEVKASDFPKSNLTNKKESFKLFSK